MESESNSLWFRLLRARAHWSRDGNGYGINQMSKTMATRTINPSTRIQRGLRLAVAVLVVAGSAYTAALGAEGPSTDYDRKLLRLAEVLGAVHHLREVCGAKEGQMWRDQMIKLINAEKPSPARRARLVK